MTNTAPTTTAQSERIKKDLKRLSAALKKIRSIEVLESNLGVTVRYCKRNPKSGRERTTSISLIPVLITFQDDTIPFVLGSKGGCNDSEFIGKLYSEGNTLNPDLITILKK